MNKTLSAIIRILAILGAIAAGVAWYFIYTQNIQEAMKQTEWLTQDPELSGKAGKDFVARMKVLNPDLKDLLNAKRAEIEKLKADLAAANATIEARDRTINEKNATISQLENDRAELIRNRDELNTQLAQARIEVSRLQGELERATADLARKNEQISTMFTKEQYEEQVAALHKSEDEKQKATIRYAKLLNWAQKETGVLAPFPRDLFAPESTETDGPRVGETPAKIPTKIIAVDRRRGVISISIGQEDGIFAPNQIYDVDANGIYVGKIRISEVRPGMSVANILPETQINLLSKDGTIHLTRARAVTSKDALKKPTPQTTPGVAATQETPVAPTASSVITVQ